MYYGELSSKALWKQAGISIYLYTIDGGVGMSMGMGYKSGVRIKFGSAPTGAKDYDYKSTYKDRTSVTLKDRNQQLLSEGYTFTTLAANVYVWASSDWVEIGQPAGAGLDVRFRYGQSLDSAAEEVLSAKAAEPWKTPLVLSLTSISNIQIYLQLEAYNGKVSG